MIVKKLKQKIMGFAKELPVYFKQEQVVDKKDTSSRFESLLARPLVKFKSKRGI